MRTAFADQAWADHHARLSANISSGIAALMGKARRLPIRKTDIGEGMAPMVERLKDQTVIVFGGSDGIGAAVAELARSEGARVVAMSRSGRAPEGVEGSVVDVADHDALAAALEAVGTVDHLVYTVGARLGSPRLETLGDEVLRLAFETKLFGAVHAVRLALPYLAPTASITFTSGQVSRKYGAGTLVKGTVNAAVDAAGRHLAKELAPRRVNVISPGVVDTGLWGVAGSEARTATIARVSDALPVKRVGAPQELAQAYLFAMTNGFVTGALIDVDGGGLL